MTSALEPEQAAAYVHELSAEVKGVVVLDAEGNHLAGPEAMAAPAKALAEAVDGGATLRTSGGLVWVAKGEERTVVAAAGPGAQPGPTALDVATAAGAPTPVLRAKSPEEGLRKAASDVLAAT